jgi:hypothetical protein
MYLTVVQPLTAPNTEEGGGTQRITEETELEIPSSVLLCVLCVLCDGLYIATHL